jgi:hypothetical protein
MGLSFITEVDELMLAEMAHKVSNEKRVPCRLLICRTLHTGSLRKPSVRVEMISLEVGHIASISKYYYTLQLHLIQNMQRRPQD